MKKNLIIGAALFLGGAWAQENYDVIKVTKNAVNSVIDSVKGILNSGKKSESEAETTSED